MTSTVTSAAMPTTIQPHDNTTMTSHSCEPFKQSVVLIMSVLPAFVTLENMFVLFAMMGYRKKLKHNNVYRYVASCLLANIVSSAFGFYHFLNYYHGFEPHDPNQWWAFRKGMTLALSLILCGNIGLLIYAIEDNTYIVGRAAVDTNQQTSKGLSPSFRKRKANLLICVVWAVPTVYGMLAMTRWNCTEICTCTLAYTSGMSICKDDSARCSNIYTPMAKSYLFVVVILWSIECMGLLGLFCNSLYQISRADRVQVSSPTSIVVSPAQTRSNGNNNTTTTSSSRRKSSIGRTLSRYRNSHQLLIILFLLFFLCTAPIMSCFAIDFINGEVYFSPLLVNILTPLPFIYCLASPLLLARRLSGVRGALGMALTFSWAKRRPAVTRRSTRTTDTMNVGMVTDYHGNNGEMAKF